MNLENIISIINISFVMKLNPSRRFVSSNNSKVKIFGVKTLGDNIVATPNEHDHLLQGLKSTQTSFVMNSNGPQKRCLGSKCAVLFGEGRSTQKARRALPIPARTYSGRINVLGTNRDGLKCGNFRDLF